MSNHGNLYREVPHASSDASSLEVSCQSMGSCPQLLVTFNGYCTCFKLKLYDFWAIDKFVYPFLLHSLHSRAIGREVWKHYIPDLLFNFGFDCWLASLSI